MYRMAYRDGDKVLYFDLAGNKHVASGGSLPWRINNPGMIRSHSMLGRRNDAIGSYEGFAIFSDVQRGREALSNWLKLKTYHHSSLHAIAKHYQPSDPNAYVVKLSDLTGLSPASQPSSLKAEEFERLMWGIEKLCGFSVAGDEQLSVLPRIIAKIEGPADTEDRYLVGNHIVLTASEAHEWVLSHHLDAVIVRQRNGTTHLRSRPHHRIWNTHISEKVVVPFEGHIDTLVRTIGRHQPPQCVWGFINGVSNSKDEALASAHLISTTAGGEVVLSMPNDSKLLGVKDCLACLILKASIDTPVITWAVEFFRYLLHLSHQDNQQLPVVVFAHSQGAIISEHALRLLSEQERRTIRIFTFGGGSFLATDACHPDSHNYASANDPVCRMGSPNYQMLALQRYYGLKKGWSIEQVIYELAMQDALLHLDTLNDSVMEAYIKVRSRYYENEFDMMRNITIVDPSYVSWEHGFANDCYQKIVAEIVHRYKKALSLDNVDAPLSNHIDPLLALASG